MNKSYKLSVFIGMNSWRIRSIVFVVATGLGPSLIKTDVLNPSWLDSIGQCHMPDSRCASAAESKVSATVTLYLHLVQSSRTHVNFGIVGELVVLALLEPSYIDIFIGPIHPAGKSIVPHHFLPVPILIIDESPCKAEYNNSDIRR